ncbi:FAD-linked oxidoreductase [Streptomyces inusitatus]|uniref:FAD-linked oxidoreductase n=1 Tax=Streptomyces inusitatus TaxID=68221 RepID=A0A918Q684_9ACTN|nr:D-arabinono-1,4-lactone oxidase [Streptomyces inusitatus]GGZ35296.1 FAD-linked oxidoreductase [Streptomyces inusitatus]
MSGVGESGTARIWRNWAGNVTARPVREISPASADEVVDAVRRAAEDGLRVRTVGTGHSFTALAAADGLLIRPDLLTGIRRVDRAAMTVTVESGTPLKRLNTVLAREGLSLANMGDIMAQTAAGAISTGTHGTGRESASLSAQITEVELVAADGSLLTCSPGENPEIFAAARLGLGALGVITAVTFAVEPLFLLRAREEPMPFDRVAAEFEALHTENEHFEFFWFPHTGHCATKRNNRSAGPAEPPGAIADWVERELVSNGLFQVASSLGRAVPATVPALARLAGRALTARSYTDIPYKVFTSPRRVRFVEMEYALPRAAAMTALREVRAMIERSPLKIGFPVEVRTAPADDIPLSTAYGRDSVYIAVHLYRGTPHRAYFTAVERIMTAHGGRPHWGKLHTRDAEYLAGVYPKFGEFLSVRDRIDPERRFGNDHLRRVLGD